MKPAQAGPGGGGGAVVLVQGLPAVMQAGQETRATVHTVVQVQVSTSTDCWMMRTLSWTVNIAQKCFP